MAQDRIEAIERQIGELTNELFALRKASEGEPIRNYEFETGAGKTTLLDLFAGNYWKRPERLEDGGQDILD